MVPKENVDAILLTEVPHFEAHVAWKIRRLFGRRCIENLEPRKPTIFFMDGNGETPSVKGMNKSYKSLRFMDFLDGVSIIL